jgi:hypothetical protein
MPELAALSCSKSRREHSALLARRSREVGALPRPSHLTSLGGSVAARLVGLAFWNRSGRGSVGTLRRGLLALVLDANTVDGGDSEGGG